MTGTKSWICAGFSLLALAAAGCNPEEVQLARQVSVEFDSSLSASEKALLAQDINAMISREMNVKHGSLYDVVFGGIDSAAVIGYLDERINYVLSQDADTDDRLRIAERFLNRGPFMMALNLGAGLWLESELARPRQLGIDINGHVVPIESSRVGVIQLGKGYTNRRLLGLGARRFNTVQRTGTLVHEARHSDCTGGLDASDLARLREGKLPKNRACTHLHVICPEGHPYEGVPACDIHPWGAYAVEAVYFGALAEACTNCSQKDKMVARAAMFDSLSRVNRAKDMMEGKFGRPDMSSIGVRP
jgi:hypothetical protein